MAVEINFMTNLRESMGPGHDRTRDPCFCSQTSYRLRYAARHISVMHYLEVLYIINDSLFHIVTKFVFLYLLFRSEI